MKPSELLRAGAEGLRARGWQRGGGGVVNLDGPCCVMHALYRIDQGDYVCRPAGGAMDVAIRGLQDSVPIGAVMHWNDNVCESQEQAIALLETVAARFEERGL